MQAKHALLVMSFSWALVGGNCVRNQLIAYKNPSENYLNLNGIIDHGLVYMVSVRYFKNAQKSGCPEYDLDTNTCQIKPETFTYSPQIQQTQHSIHIPLKELSPEANSWWEPRNISICVGPENQGAPPYQCQVVFVLSKQKNDGNQVINLICSDDFWCNQGLNVEHVSKLNRDYRVNISKLTTFNTTIP